jgi:hypothetical protein
MSRLKYLIVCTDCHMQLAAQVSLMKQTVVEHLQRNPNHILLVSAVVV